MPNLLQLLGSKNTGDVTETIKLILYLKQFKVASADVIIISYPQIKVIFNSWGLKKCWYLSGQKKSL